VMSAFQERMHDAVTQKDVDLQARLGQV
jgi:hypothetical protein